MPLPQGFLRVARKYETLERKARPLKHACYLSFRQQRNLGEEVKESNSKLKPKLNKSIKFIEDIK